MEVQVTPPSVDLYMTLVRLLNTPPPSFIPAMKTLPSGPTTGCTLRMKPPVWTCTGVLQEVPSSEYVTKMFCPAAKSFHETYIRPLCALVMLLSTHIEGRSSNVPL